MKQIHVPAGTTIVKRGEPGDTFCIVESGTCTVLGEDGQVRPWHQLPDAQGIQRNTQLGGLTTTQQRSINAQI